MATKKKTKVAQAKAPRPASTKAAVPRASRPLTPSVWTRWTINQIRQALYAHENGDFASSAQLADQLRRDPRIFATLDTRVLGALGLPYSTLPSDEATSRTQAEEIATRVSAWWFRCIPESVLADVLRNVVLMGFAVGELIWSEVWVPSSRNVGDYELRPRLRIHHPSFVRYDSARDGGWYLQTLDGEERIRPGDGRWVLFSNGDDRPWMNGAIRALAVAYKIRTEAQRDWARRNEIDGIGIKKAKTPKDVTDQKVLDKFLRQVQALGEETTLALPEGYDVTIEATALSAAEGFSRLIGAMDLSITLTLLGANLPTEAKSGGSYALGAIQAEAQLDRLEADVGTVSTTCREQIVKAWGRFNVEGWVDELACWNHWDATRPPDLKAQGDALYVAAQALEKFLSFGLDVRPILEKFGLRLGEHANETATAPIYKYHLDYGVLSKNEIRARIGFAPVDGGDAPPLPVAAEAAPANDNAADKPSA